MNRTEVIWVRVVGDSLKETLDWGLGDIRDRDKSDESSYGIPPMLIDVNELDERQWSDLGWNAGSVLVLDPLGKVYSNMIVPSSVYAMISVEQLPCARHYFCPEQAEMAVLTRRVVRAFESGLQGLLDDWLLREEAPRNVAPDYTTSQLHIQNCRICKAVLARNVTRYKREHGIS